MSNLTRFFFVKHKCAMSSYSIIVRVNRLSLTLASSYKSELVLLKLFVF